MAITKKILLSIQPQWVEKILNGEKTIEIRKIMPKCELPARVYIYCTKGNPQISKHKLPMSKLGGLEIVKLNGKVVAEFILKWCDKRSIAGLTHSTSDFNTFLKRAGINWYKNSKEFYDYVSKKDYIYAWYISDLKIYDNPKELSEFGLIKAPQSWCYIKE